MTWPPQSLDLNPIEMDWDELDLSVKKKQPTNAQRMWELLQDCWKSIPGEAGWENTKSVQSCQAKSGDFEECQIWNIFRFVCNFFDYYITPCVLIHSFDAFTFILKIVKIKENPWMSRLS